MLKVPALGQSILGRCGATGCRALWLRCGVEWSSLSVGDNPLGAASRSISWLASSSSPHHCRHYINRRCRRKYSSKMSTSVCDGKDDSQCLVLKLLASCVCIADRAGGLVRSIMSGGDLGIVDKGVNDLQTEADRSVQRCVMASLHKLFPDVAVFGEEDQHQDSLATADWIETSLSDDVLVHTAAVPNTVRSATHEQICIWVDPLDGTAEYTQGLLDHVTVLIGIAVNGEAIAGVIHQPYFNYKNKEPNTKLGRTIWGLVGLGSFGFELKSPDPTQRIVVTTQSHETEAVRNAIAACEPTEVLRVGGAGHKVLLLIEGKAHAYIFASPGCKKWDTCAPEAVLHAIGGTLTDVHGDRYHYGPTVRHQNTGGVLATATGQPHSWYLEKMPDEVKSSLPTK